MNKDEKDRVLLPPGNYNAIVVGATPRESKNTGKEYTILRHVILDGPYEGEHVNQAVFGKVIGVVHVVFDDFTRAEVKGD